jgi:hypothetical protein
MSALVFLFFQDLGGTHHFACALRERRPPKGSKRGGRELQLLLDLKTRKSVEGLYHFAGRRIDGRDCHGDLFPFRCASIVRPKFISEFHLSVVQNGAVALELAVDATIEFL